MQTIARRDTLTYNCLINLMSSLMNQLEKCSPFLADDRLKGFVIEVQRGRNTHQCARVTGQLRAAETRRISCKQGAIGNIVKVRLTSKKPQILTLCEVEVFGIIGKKKRC